MNDHEQEVLQVGSEARELLGNAAYNSVVDELRGTLIADWIHSTNRDDREDIHHKVAALMEIQMILFERVNAADRILLEREETEDDEGML